MAIALSHGGSNIYSSSSRSNRLLVGTKQGVLILEHLGESQWRPVHTALSDRFISSIIIEPSSGMIFAGSFFGSVFASGDGGLTWEQRSNGMTVDDVYSLAAVRYKGTVRLYAGTEPAHLFTSEDLGLHWRELPAMRAVPSVPKWSFPAPPHIAHTKFITFDPGEPSTLYACIEQGALLMSRDSGESWTELNTVGLLADKNRPVEHFYDIHKAIIDPRNPKRIYVSGGAGLYVTSDRGGHWERWGSPQWAADVYPDGLVLNPRRPDIMFVSAAEHNPARWRDGGTPGYSGSKIFRSTDGGRSWETLCHGLPERMRHEVGALCLEDWQQSFSVFAATTAGEVYSSEDGGDHWSLIYRGSAPVAKKGHDRLLATA